MSTEAHMRKVGRKLRFALAPLTALLIVSTVAATVPVGIPACNLAATWVNEHLAEIPTTYSEFVAYPSAYRRYMYTKLPTEAKIGLWRTQLEQALKKDGYSPTERKFIKRMYDRIPEFVAHGS